MQSQVVINWNYPLTRLLCMHCINVSFVNNAYSWFSFVFVSCSHSILDTTLIEKLIRIPYEIKQSLQLCLLGVTTVQYTGNSEIWPLTRGSCCRIIEPEALKQGNMSSLGFTSKEQRNLGLLVHLMTTNPKILYSPIGSQVDKVIQKASRQHCPRCRCACSMLGNSKTIVKSSTSSDTIIFFWQNLFVLSSIY